MVPVLRSSPKPITSWTASAAPRSAPRSSSLLRAWSTFWVGTLCTLTHTILTTIFGTQAEHLILYCWSAGRLERKTQVYWVLCLLLCFSVRCCGSLPRHKASGAGHQGNSRVLREAAAAPEGHQPCVEQPNGLHVTGQAHRKMLWNEDTDVRTHLSLCYRPSAQRCDNRPMCWSLKLRVASDVWIAGVDEDSVESFFQLPAFASTAGLLFFIPML